MDVVALVLVVVVELVDLVLFSVAVEWVVVVAVVAVKPCACCCRSNSPYHSHSVVNNITTLTVVYNNRCKYSVNVMHVRAKGWKKSCLAAFQLSPICFCSKLNNFILQNDKTKSETNTVRNKFSVVTNNLFFATFSLKLVAFQ